LVRSNGIVLLPSDSKIGSSSSNQDGYTGLGNDDLAWVQVAYDFWNRFLRSTHRHRSVSVDGLGFSEGITGFRELSVEALVSAEESIAPPFALANGEERKNNKPDQNQAEHCKYHSGRSHTTKRQSVYAVPAFFVTAAFSY
jgi:hypothetical protein